MVMYDELVKRLRETSIDFGELDHVSVMLIEAADAIEDLITALTASNEVIAKSKQQWIPVTDRLPDHRTTCLIVDDGVVVVGWRNLIGEWYDVAGDRLKYVTHWMPLPEPPESEE